ncbi:peptidyl-prolyl cis-trans isomerase [Lacinutrix salivirga]
MRYKINILYLAIATLLTSCNYFNTVDTSNAIARVNEEYLYQDDIKNLVPENATKEDSTQLVNSFINSWATQQLLLQGAKINLNEYKQAEYDELVEQYKTDLYSKAYLEALVNKNLDTIVNANEAEAYYNQNTEAFMLNEDLIKFRYINIDAKRLDLKEITEKFKVFNNANKRDLDSISIQFKSYSLNDSVWIKVDKAIEKIPVLSPENREELLKKSNFIQLKDSLGLYLMQIEDVATRNTIAPLEYVRPTVNQIVINKRKLDLITQLKKDITKDAIKNKKFELLD